MKLCWELRQLSLQSILGRYGYFQCFVLLLYRTSFVVFHYVKRHYVEWLYVEWHYVECLTIEPYSRRRWRLVSALEGKILDLWNTKNRGDSSWWTGTQIGLTIGPMQTFLSLLGLTHNAQVDYQFTNSGELIFDLEIGIAILQWLIESVFSTF